MARIIGTISLACLAASFALAQSGANTPPSTPSVQAADPYGCDTPKSAALAFLRSAHNGSFSVAAMYLQLTDRERSQRGELLARQLRELMDRAFAGHVQLLNDQPEGSLVDGLPANRERAGTITVGPRTTDLLLARTSPSKGPPIWLVSAETLREVPGLYSNLESSPLDRWVPGFLLNTTISGVGLSQWLLLLVLVPVSWGAARLMLWLLSTIVRPLRPHLHVGSSHAVGLHAPLTVILTVMLDGVAMSWLRIPLLSRLYYNRVLWIVVTCAVAWLISRIVQRAAAAASARVTGSSWATVSSAVLLGRRVFDAILIILVVILSLNILGFDTHAALAGLGIGGIAIALGAQKTLENFLGGVNLLSDGMLRIGDRYQLGNRVGTVEDVRLRSTRFRMTEGTALTIPNGALAAREIENVSERQRTLFQCSIQLSRETTAAQLRTVLDETRRILSCHENVEPRDSRVRLTAFGAFSLDLELFAYIRTGDAAEFIAIREGILFEIMDVIEASGTRLAYPSQTLYFAGENSPDAAKLETANRRTAGHG